jgi:hypothetical protein
MTTEARSREGEGVPTGPSLNPQIIGQAENALRALLERTLAGTSLAYRHWVALSVIAGSEAPARRERARCARRGCTEGG